MNRKIGFNVHELLYYFGNIVNHPIDFILPIFSEN